MSKFSFSILLAPIVLAFSGCSTFSLYVPVNNTDTRELARQMQLIVDQAVNEFKLPGIQAGLLLPSGEAVVVASGTEDFARKGRPIQSNSMFHVGSVTKTFTASLICRLVEHGKLSLDNTVERWFAGAWASSVTVRQLLNHSSGIPDTLFTEPFILMTSTLEPATRWQPKEVVARLTANLKLPPVEQRHFVYSNLNYILLGLIAEAVDGRPLASQFKSEFFDPLGMDHTCLLPLDNPPAELVGGYDEYIPFGPHLITGRTTAWDSLTWAAGSVATTAGDLLLWQDAYWHDRVVSPASRALMQNWLETPNNGRDDAMVAYGFGLSRYQVGSFELIGHPGGAFGGEAFPFWWPQGQVAVTVSYNLSRMDNPAGKTVLLRLLELAQNTMAVQ